MEMQEIYRQMYAQYPVLEEIIETNRNVSLIDYLSSHVEVTAPLREPRHEEFISILQSEVMKRLGPDVGKGVADQIRQYGYVSTTDHHGPLGHPWFSHSHIMNGLANASRVNHPYQIVLACSNIPLNNSSYPRGILCRSFSQDIIPLAKFTLFPWKDRHTSVFGLKGYGPSAVENLQKFLENSCAGVSSAENIQEVSDIYSSPLIFEQESYSDQITILNYKLWKRIKAVSRVNQFPDLVYAPLENIVTRLFINHHSAAPTEIHRLVFDLGLQPEILALFNDIPGAYSADGRGTYLFWHREPITGMRRRLWPRGEFLISEDNFFSIHLDPESIAKALESQTLIPSMLLNLLMVSCYYGITCLGGFSQVNYSTWMQEKYSYLFPAAKVASKTKLLSGDFVTINLSHKNRHCAASAIDMALHAGTDFMEKCLEVASQTSVGEAWHHIVPGIYNLAASSKISLSNYQGIYNESLHLSSDVFNPCITI